MSDQTPMGGAGTSGSARDLGLLATPLPSLDWALGELTDEWPQDGDSISCPLPGHDDSTPSFNLWAENEKGIPQRWGCFGCGRNGDVVDLIALLRGITADEALRVAGEMAAAEPDNFRDTERPRATVVIVDMAEELSAISAKMTQRDFETLQRFMASKGMTGEELERFAMDSWQWAASDGRIVIPHLDGTGKVTAIKYRAGERRWNENGSHFIELYGSWRDRGFAKVLLCEGESDTVWASFALRGMEIDVLGLPSGAGQGIKQEWLERLEDRALVLAFDGDEAGIIATRRWCESRKDSTVARLPEGEDLLSCGVPVQELVERASLPRRAFGFVDVVGGVFVRETKDGQVPLGDFAFRPVRELFTEEGPAWEGRFEGDHRDVLLRAGDMLSVSTFTRWANQNGYAWTGGSGQAVQGVFNWMTAESAFLPLERATTKAGKIGRSFVGPGFCIGPDRIRYINPGLGDAKLESRIHIQEGPWDPMALLALERLNDPAVMATILGWLCASLLRGQRAPAPPLFVSGESGAGKTNMLSSVLTAFGFATEVNLTTTTPYGIDCMINSSIGFPVWFDEYRGGAREDSMMRLRQMLRDAYYGQPSMKGGMRQQATELSEVTTWAGIVVSGEMSSGETSHRDRMIMLDLDKDGKNRDAYNWLRDNKTDGLGYALLTFLAARPDKLFRIEAYEDEPDLPDRFRDTLGFVRAGWDAWQEFRWTVAGLRDAPQGPNYQELAEGRQASEDPWIEALRACVGVASRSGDAIVRETEDGIEVLTGELIIEAKRLGIELPARANELLSYLRSRYEVRQHRIGTRRAHLIVGLDLDNPKK